MSANALVCVVDDEAPIRRLIRAQLEPEGFEIVDAESGNQALAIIERRLPSVAIIDLIMPDGEGLSLIRTLKQNWPGLLILAMSGGGSRGPTEQLKAARRLGADDTIAKPFTRDDMVMKVRALLKR